MDTPLSTIAVVGLGTMGTGIAEVLALAGREVIGIDTSEAAARQAVTSLEASTARAVGRGGSPSRSGPRRSPGSVPPTPSRPPPTPSW